MEIQDLTSDNYYRKPILLPDRPHTHAPQETDVFRSSQGLLEISLSTENHADFSRDNEIHNPERSLLGTHANDIGALPLADLKIAFEEKSAELADQLRHFFSAQGIHAPVAADLTVDSQGRVVVSGNEKVRDAIQSDVSEFEPLVSELNEAASLLRAADVSPEFSKTYERTPELAIKENAHLFSNSFKFTYRFENDHLSASFRSSSGASIDWWQEQSTFI